MGWPAILMRAVCWAGGLGDKLIVPGRASVLSEGSALEGAKGTGARVRAGEGTWDTGWGKVSWKQRRGSLLGGKGSM